MKSVAICALIALIALIACTAPQTTPGAQVCFPVQYWSPQDQASLAASLETVPANDPITRMALNWQSMRDKLRACRSGP